VPADCFGWFEGVLALDEEAAAAFEAPGFFDCAGGVSFLEDEAVGGFGAAGFFGWRGGSSPLDEEAAPGLPGILLGSYGLMAEGVMSQMMEQIGQPFGEK